MLGGLIVANNKKVDNIEKLKELSQEEILNLKIGDLGCSCSGNVSNFLKLNGVITVQDFVNMSIYFVEKYDILTRKLADKIHSLGLYFAGEEERNLIREHYEEALVQLNLLDKYKELVLQREKLLQEEKRIEVEKKLMEAEMDSVRQSVRTYVNVSYAKSKK